MKKSKVLLCGLVALFLIFIIFVFYFHKQSDESQEKGEQARNQTEQNENLSTPEKINDLKNEIHATAKNDIYQVEKESSGRTFLQVKPQVQFEVDLAGILKNAKPEEDELEELLQQAPTEDGVWIAKQARNDFLQLLKANQIENFTIDSNGYLQKNGASMTNLANALEQMMQNHHLYILNMTGMAYQRDYLTGEIMEYPFEEMDPEQIVEPYQNDRSVTLEITSNQKGKVTPKEILETIVQYTNL